MEVEQQTITTNSNNKPTIDTVSTTIAPKAVTFLVVGGGIAGVTCAENLAMCCPNESILLLTESSVVKTVANLMPIARYLYKFDVQERSIAASDDDRVDRFALPHINTMIDQLRHVDATNKYVITRSNQTINYRYMCICTGGAPRLIRPDDSLVLGIRDTDSVLELQRRLHEARSIVLVGNGGIASELAYELHGVQVHWVIKDKHIASTFVDPGAALFFQKSRNQKKESENAASTPATSAIKRMRYSEIVPKETEDGKRGGAALGPDWHRNFELIGGLREENDTKADNTDNLFIHYQSNIRQITTDTESNRVTVELTTGETITCDFLVSATGVDPRHEFTMDTPLEFAPDGGISVNEMMETNLPGIYAAGDVCTAGWSAAEHWFQMRLWTQARQMGAMAGRSMSASLEGETIYQDFCFEIFGHCTQLFGFPVVLIGRYNGQDLGTDYEILLRTTPGKEYIKFVLQRGRLRGAILIGNTELAETCENLILNGIDLTPYGDDILNPDIDIEDYFD